MKTVENRIRCMLVKPDNYMTQNALSLGIMAVVYVYFRVRICFSSLSPSEAGGMQTSR